MLLSMTVTGGRDLTSQGPIDDSNWRTEVAAVIQQFDWLSANPGGGLLNPVPAPRPCHRLESPL